MSLPPISANPGASVLVEPPQPVARPAPAPGYDPADAIATGGASGLTAVAPAWQGTSLRHMLGKWKVESTFLDAAGVAHAETAIYKLSADDKLDGSQWLEGVYSGRRSDGSPAFTLRFMHHIDPQTKAMVLYEFGNSGTAFFPNQTRDGADDGNGKITWKGKLADGTPFVEVWQIGASAWSFEARIDVPNGPVIATGKAKRP